MGEHPAEIGLRADPAHRRAIAIQHLQHHDGRNPGDGGKQDQHDRAHQRARDGQLPGADPIHQRAAVDGEEKGQHMPRAEHQADPRRSYSLLGEPERQHDRGDIREAVGKEPDGVNGNLRSEGGGAGWCRHRRAPFSIAALIEAKNDRRRGPAQAFTSSLTGAGPRWLGRAVRTCRATCLG